MFLKDREGRYLLVNRRVAELFGRPQDEILGRRDEDLLDPEQAAEWRASDETVIASGTSLTLEQANSIAGVEYTTIVSKFPLRTPDGVVYAVGGTATDITELRNAERARAGLEAQLYQADKLRAIGTLAGGIAHDFNNLLTAILSNAELAAEEVGSAHPGYEPLVEVVQAAERAADLVGQLLTFSRRSEPRRSRVRIDAVAAEALRLIRASLPASVRIVTDFPPDPTAVFIDASQVHQVFMNLAANAAQAIGRTGGTLTVASRVVDVIDAAALLAPGRYVRVSVTDTGCGMDQTTLDRVFEPFFTTRPPGQGTGLGLAVVHGIMRSHDGAAVLESEPGVGTTVHLFFPVAGDAPETTTPHVPTLSRGRGQRVLVVDDESVLARVTARIVESLGYEVVVCSDPIEAQGRFEAAPQRFDAALIDLTMPGTDGLTLSNHLLHARPGLPVLLMSGFAASLNVEQARAAGIREVIAKPFTRHDLASALSRVLLPVSSAEPSSGS